MLISAQQLTRVPPRELRNSTVLRFSAVEEDHDGPVLTSYEVHRGLVGRTVYNKELSWQPTKRRPDAIEQHGTLRAVLDSQGVLLRMRSAIHLSTDVSKQPRACLMSPTFRSSVQSPYGMRSLITDSMLL